MLETGRSEIDESAAIVAEEFGAAGTYTPQVGDPVDLIVIMTYDAERLLGEYASEVRDMAHVRMADITEPAAGDSLSVDGETWTVDTYIRSGALWALTLLPVQP